jgi:hypothetical protein
MDKERLMVTKGKEKVIGIEELLRLNWNGQRRGNNKLRLWRGLKLSQSRCCELENEWLR